MTIEIKRKPKDFVVIEEATYEMDENGNHFLYLLTKKNLTTRELASLLGFSYAGLKDKTALTVQHVSFPEFKGRYIKNRLKNGIYFLKFKGKIRKKIKIGNLKGNKFFIKLHGQPIKPADYFINFYGIQRLKGNVNRGKKLFKRLSENPRKLKWRENFLIDAFLSFLWNETLNLYLSETVNGTFKSLENLHFFIPTEPYKNIKEKIPKFWTIAGYKKEYGKSWPFYKKILAREGIEAETFIKTLKNLKIKGDFRKTYLPVNASVKNDFITFSLPKGSYATVYLLFCSKEGKPSPAT
ncbi:tRNA pseudouridine(13) synthase TruD [Desulfurobacterium sp.]